MRGSTLLSVVVCLALVQAAFGLYGAKSNVIALTSKNFADNVIASEHVWVVEFFAPVCSVLLTSKVMNELLIDNFMKISLSCCAL